jgi:hypothetical protein
MPRCAEPRARHGGARSAQDRPHSPLAGPMRGAAQVRENTVSVAQKINDFITSHRPEPVCNRCIAQGIGLSDYGAPPGADLRDPGDDRRLCPAARALLAVPPAEEGHSPDLASKFADLPRARPSSPGAAGRLPPCRKRLRQLRAGRIPAPEGRCRERASASPLPCNRLGLSGRRIRCDRSIPGGMECARCQMAVIYLYDAIRRVP